MGKLLNVYKTSFLLKDGVDQEFLDCIEDLMQTEEVLCLAQYEQHLDIDRLQHVMSVSYLSFRACKKLGLDFTAAARGALLHDLFFYDWHEKDKSHKLHGYRHPGFALQNAKNLTQLSQKEENIIVRHMWPLTITPPKFKESFIVSMSDKYCATRELLYSFSVRYNIKFLDIGLEVG